MNEIGELMTFEALTTSPLSSPDNLITAKQAHDNYFKIKILTRSLRYMVRGTCISAITYMLMYSHVSHKSNNHLHVP